MKVSRRAYPWIAIAVQALLIPVVYAFMKMIAPEPDGCTGIGFGCSLDQETVGYIGAVLYAVGLGFMAVIVGLCEFGGAKWQNARNAITVIGSSMLLLFVLSAGGS